MKIQLLVVILGISITVGYARGPKKMIMGKTAMIGEFPHQVSLQTVEGSHFCGGSIIGPEFILTAAHCIVDRDGKPNNYEINVLVGTNDRELRTSDHLFRVERRIHHNFHPINSNKNDIAILQLDRPIKFNNMVKPVKLSSKDVPAGIQVMSSGWGATKYNRSINDAYDVSRYLQKLERTVIPQELCKKGMKDFLVVVPEHICVYSSNGADTCLGDSGGSLIYNGEVIGVTSYGVGCALTYPEVVTRISHYLEWIKTVESLMTKKLPVPKNSPEFVEA